MTTGYFIHTIISIPYSPLRTLTGFCFMIKYSALTATQTIFTSPITSTWTFTLIVYMIKELTLWT